MYTIIEFFDEEPVENVITALKFHVSRIIFVGYQEFMTENRRRAVEKLLKGRDPSLLIKYMEVNRYDLGEIVETLQTAVMKEKKDGYACCFDLTGGEELILTAMGILAAGGGVPMHQIQVSSGTMIPIECPDYMHSLSGHKESGKEAGGGKNLGIEEMCPEQQISLTVLENIVLHGGIIDETTQSVSKSSFSKEDIQDIHQLWEMAKEEGEAWNAYSRIFRDLSKYKLGEPVLGEPEEIKAETRELKHILSGVAGKWKIGITEFQDVIRQLKARGIFYDGYLDEEKGIVSIIVKNSRLMDILREAGSILELYLFLVLKETPEYRDVTVGTHIDWDGVIHRSPDKIKDTVNEVDIMMMRGAVPVFISCKNGQIDKEALYELDTVASRFGGRYAKKIIVAPYIGAKSKNDYFNQRALDMGIGVIEDIYQIDEDTLRKRIDGFTR